MKKFIAIVAAVVAAAPVLKAQDVYSLPQTAIRIDVKAVKESFHAGPYAEYAKKYLGIDAKLEDETSCHVTEVTMTPTVEADLSARYNLPAAVAAPTILTLSSQGLVSIGADCVGSASSWRFPAANKADFSDKGVTSNLAVEASTLYKSAGADKYSTVSVQQNMVVEKSLEKRAAEAADMIFALRKTRVQIITGDTDMTYSGEAMGAAVNEMLRIEKEYMTMFIGYTDRQKVTYSTEIIPDASKGIQKYVVFRVSDTEGLVSADNISGTPVILDLATAPAAEPAAATAEKPAKGVVEVYYRVPAICSATLSLGADKLLEGRIPVYQLGETASVKINTK